MMWQPRRFVSEESPPDNQILRVICGGCHRPMRKNATLALVYYTNVQPTVHTEWVCDTHDCGTVTQLEEDL